MRSTNVKGYLGWTLLAALLLVAAGCGKSKAPEQAPVSEQPAATAGAPVSPEEARKIYQEGAEAYQASKFDVAASKFKSLAERGDASAQFNLGVLYHQGQGVAQDDKQAVEWWTKAAEQGHTDAMDNLGLRYAKGEGVTQDWAQAYKWFSIAGMRKNVSGASNAKVAASKMTPEQVELAQNLAKDWMVQHQPQQQ
jgi:TPR repeat protein